MQSISWPYAYLLYLGVGTTLCLGMLFGSRPRYLRWLGQLPYCSPNWITLWRIPVIWVGQYLYITAHGDHTLLFTGFLLVAGGLMLDRLDGKMAKVLLKSLKQVEEKVECQGNVVIITQLLPNQKMKSGLTSDGQVWAWYEEKVVDNEGNETIDRYKIALEYWVWQLTVPATRLPMFKVVADEKNSFDRQLKLTGIGEWLDPLVDKFNFLPFYVYLGHASLMNIYVVLIVVSLDLFSSFMREPFKAYWPFSKLQPFVNEAKATPLGKFKIIFQFIALLAVMPAAAGWLNTHEAKTSYYIVSSMLALAALIGMGSVISRLTLREWLISSREGKRGYGLLRRFFDHDIEE